MTKDVSMRLHRIFNVIVAAFVGLCGICFGVACLYIYFEKGEYSREIVAEVFSYIAVPVYISVVHVIAGLIYELVSPLKRKKEKPERDRRFLLSRLSGKKNFSECDKAS
ncbi:MAG: hypothetical protein IKU19_05315, partial [Clostridia bacterium]|nr:hypothetical protein [Clostridia bacterium]